MKKKYKIIVAFVSQVDIIASLTQRTQQQRGYKMTREQLTDIYLDWLNNYVSVARFAEHYGLYEDEAAMLIKLAKSCFENPHPEA